MRVNLLCGEIVKMENHDYGFFWCKLRNQPIGLGCDRCDNGRVDVGE